MLNEIIEEVKHHSDSNFANWVAPILQVADGGYGENDKLLGVRTPVLRKIAKKYSDTEFDDILLLIKNEIHEIRLIGLFMLIHLYKSNKYLRGKIVNSYIACADYINNWDLVDQSAPYIIGDFVYNNQECISILYDLSDSNHLWKQRIAIVATQYLIKQGFYEPTITLSEKYITHPHHLIHKATGWMLRELGKKDINELYGFLDKFAKSMPRVMLRYAIERLDDVRRKHYMALK